MKTKKFSNSGFTIYCIISLIFLIEVYKQHKYYPYGILLSIIGWCLWMIFWRKNTNNSFGKWMYRSLCYFVYLGLLLIQAHLWVGIVCGFIFWFVELELDRDL